VTTNTGASSLEPNPEEKRGDASKGDPEELLHRTEARAEAETRTRFRELWKWFERGAAFQAGKKVFEKGEEALEEFINDLMQN
jgi:hypothetical protein